MFVRGRRWAPPHQFPGFLLVAALVAGAGFSGCGRDRPPGAIGTNAEISVFTNDPPDPGVVAALKRVFEYPYVTVGEEDAFRLDLVTHDDFRIHRHVKNQIFAVDLSRDDRISRVVPGLLSDEGRRLMTGRNSFRFLVADRFASGQTTLFLIGWSGEDLVRLLTEVGAHRIRREFESAVVEALTETIFAMGEEERVPSRVARDYGWTIRLPEGYHGAVHEDGNFVKFNAREPVRLILCHWIEEEVPLAAEAWSPILDRVLRVYNDGDYADPEDTVVFPEPFQGEPALRWEGVWQNDKYTIGGPFRAWAFHRGGRSFVLVGQTFAPGADKSPTLRQVEAAMHTFHLPS